MSDESLLITQARARTFKRIPRWTLELQATFLLVYLVSVKCMLNAYVIEILVVQVLYMIRKLTEARVYFIALVLFLV